MSETKNRSKNLLAVAIAGVISGIVTGSAVAQSVGGGQVEEIAITGTRIRNTSGFSTPVPVTAITPAELANFEPGGTVSSQLANLPQFFETRTLADTSSPSNTNRSASGLNLRSLGANRTLVLMDGNRIVTTDKEGTVNVDILPTALMRTVDIVTGGASAAYGADAVGGVVNFIIDREFEGLKTTVGTGVHERNDGGENWEIEVAGGRSFLDQRLHLIGSAQHTQVAQTGGTAKVENFRRIGHVTNPAWVANPSLRGTMGTPQRLTLPDVVSTLSSPTGLIQAPGTPLNFMQFNRNGTDIERFILGDVVSLPGTTGSTQSMSGGPEAKRAYDTFGTSPSVGEAIARSFFFGAKYDFNDRLSLKFDAKAGRTEANESGAAFARSGGFELEGTWRAAIAVDNAYLPEGVRQLMVANKLKELLVSKLGGYDDRPVEGSDQNSRNVATQWEWGVGFTYDIPVLEWTLEGRLQQGEAKRTRQSYNRGRVDRLFLAMDAIRDPKTGAIVCRVQTVNPTVEQLRASPAIVGKVSKIPLNPWNEIGAVGNTKPLESPIGLDNTIRDCVPFNVMGSGNINAAALDYIGQDKFGIGYVNQDFAELFMTGNIFNLPAGPVEFAAGLTWRDQQFIDGAFAGSGIGVGGKVVTNEDLGPALNDPALGIRGIAPGYTGGSAVISQFVTIPTVAGQSDVWEWYGEVNLPVLDTNLGGNWNQQIVTNLAYRESTYNRSGVAQSWKVGIDYQFHSDWRLRYTSSQDVREPTFSELFDARGGGGNVNDPRFNNTNFQITVGDGGNRDLLPEKGLTDVVGVVWQPRFLPIFEDLQISLDWWNTKIEGQVATLGGQRIVNECELNKILCSQIDRDPVTGIITKVRNQFLNLAGSKAEGIDLEVVWKAEPDLLTNELESFTLRWLASHLIEQSTTPLGGVPFNQAGDFNTPDYTHVMTINYGIGDLSFQIQNRFNDSSVLDASWKEGIDVDDNSIASMSWWNTRIGYQGERANGSTWNLGFNIQNVFNRDPSIVPGFSTRGGTQAFVSNFDRFGRRYNLNLNYNF